MTPGVVKLLSATAGSGTVIAFGHEFNDIERAIAGAVVVFVALLAGDMWRRATVSPENEKAELKRSIMSIGALYIIALAVAQKMDADIYGAAMTAVTVGAGGPLILAAVQSRAAKILNAILGKE
jgi:putative Mn2+ efflux pump MntP